MTTLVLGAGGVIGGFIATDLVSRGLPVIAAARHFTPAERAQFGPGVREIPIARLDTAALTRMLEESAADVVVNCLGVLQDTAGDSTHEVHLAFVERLIAALRAVARPILLVHLSIPGVEADDRTSFSRTKRVAEQTIANSGLPYAILRPGFVFAPRAFGGGAMMRALAALPIDLPAALASRAFSAIAMEDIAETIYFLVQHWQRPDPHHAAIWELMNPAPSTIGDVVAGLRTWLGAAWWLRVPLPMCLLKLAALAGDLSAWFGWRPPIRSTVLDELQRGVSGDPRVWMQATGIAPRALDSVLQSRPATVQEKWFARLYLLKTLIVVVLAVFWIASALIALTVAYPAAVAILTAHGYTQGWAQAATIVSGLTDLVVGLAIAFRRTSSYGLVGGIAVSLFYMIAAAFMTPEIWVEPLGALVKTGPAIVLMLVALAIIDDR